ncbi:MAG TPA: STAS domain-containing protein [Gaiellaceae bacterium]|nr:STAS domain-containing protein [Gaiellaceae bacterium]
MSAPAPDPGVSVLRLRGAADALRLRTAVVGGPRRHEPLIVDLSDASSLDPATAALLVDAVARCEEAGRPCVLLVPRTCPERVRGLFERRGLTRLLPIASSWDEALRRAGRSAA